jgi:hypothetical protein
MSGQISGRVWLSAFILGFLAILAIAFLGQLTEDKASTGHSGDSSEHEQVAIH